jgi:hypothetical protein
MLGWHVMYFSLAGINLPAAPKTSEVMAKKHHETLQLYIH